MIGQISASNQLRTSSELAPNRFGASSEPASVMEFGFKWYTSHCQNACFLSHYTVDVCFSKLQQARNQKNPKLSHYPVTYYSTVIETKSWPAASVSVTPETGTELRLATNDQRLDSCLGARRHNNRPHVNPLTRLCRSALNTRYH